MSHQNPSVSRKPLAINQIGCCKKKEKKRKEIGRWLSSLALRSIFTSSKPLALTLFPSIKNLADSWDGCCTSAAPAGHPAPPGSPGAKPGVGGPSGIPARSCLIVTLQVTCCVPERRWVGWGGLHSVYAAVVLRLWAYLLSTANKALTCSQAV